MKIFSQIISSVSILSVLGCSSLSQKQDFRNPAQENSFEALCSSKMDLDFTKLTIASLFHRDHPDRAKQLKLRYNVQLKMKDESIVSTFIPSFENPNSQMQEMSGINFPAENNAPFVEYRVLTQMDWVPLNAEYNFPYLEGPWTKTQMAGLCLNFSPPLPLSLQIAGDLTEKGISQILRVQFSYEISGKKIQYIVPFSGNTASSEVLIPASGLSLNYQLTWVQNGQAVKGSPKTIEIPFSQSDVLISLPVDDL